MTVSMLTENLTYSEYLSWVRFYEQRNKGIDKDDGELDSPDKVAAAFAKVIT